MCVLCLNWLTNLTLNRFDSDWGWWRQRQRQPNTVFIYECSKFAIIFFFSFTKKEHTHFHFDLCYQHISFEFCVVASTCAVLSRINHELYFEEDDDEEEEATRRETDKNAYNGFIITFQTRSKYALARCAHIIRIHYSSIMLSWRNFVCDRVSMYSHCNIHGQMKWSPT